MAERELAREETDVDNVVELPVEGTVPEVLRRFGALVRRKRERKGWSQRNLAEAIKSNHEAIRRIESGRADPRIELAMRLSMVLDVTEEELRQVMLGQTSAARAKRRMQNE